MQKMKTENGFHIRLAEEADAEKLLEIYAPYVQKTAITFEYEVPSKEEFCRRIQTVKKRYPYLIAEKDKEILGYAYASAFYGRKAYDWAAELSVYVKSDARRGGIGKGLYQLMEELLKKQGVVNAYACLAYAENEDAFLTNASLHFHEKMGYQKNARFHKSGYKFQTWYDSIWMEKFLGDHLKIQQPLVLFPDLKQNLV